MLDAPTLSAPLSPPITTALPAAAGKATAMPFADALEQCLVPSSPDAAQGASPSPAAEAALPVLPTDALPMDNLPADVLRARPAPGSPERPALPNPNGAAPEAAKNPDAEPPHRDEETERADDPPVPASLVLLPVQAPPPTLPPAPAKPAEAHGLPHGEEAAAPAPARKTLPSLAAAEPDAGKPPSTPPDAPGQAATPAAVPDHQKAAPHAPLEGPSPFASQPPAPALQPSAPSQPVAAPLPSPPTTPTLPMPQVAPVVASVAATLREGQPHTLVIRLDPAELGRVEVQIERDLGGPARISLSAERPDTLHAMQRDQAQLHRALDLAGVPPDGRQVQYQLAPADPSPLPPGSFGGSGGFAGTGGHGPGGGGPGARDRHGRYAWAGEDPSPTPSRRRLAGVDITA